MCEAVGAGDTITAPIYTYHRRPLIVVSLRLSLHDHCTPTREKT